MRLPAFTLLLSSCATMPVTDFSAHRPCFDPVTYFTGRTASTGVMENRAGDPTKTVTTRTTGKITGGILQLEQDLRIGGESSHRSWRIRRIDPHHFEATANDIAGTARGEARGNAFHWKFTLRAKPGNPLFNVTMSQWMYLQPDGRTMLNHTTISKAGLVIAQVTEQFARE